MKYSNYIALSPNYESVVDIDSEHRNPNLWREYVVHEDMIAALEKICTSLKYEAPDKRRSFWIHGAYGTGKTYAAIVLKHLFEDNIDDVYKFLSNTLLVSYRERFLAFREKGEFLVIWKSGEISDIHTGTQLIMAMEAAIREKLTEKFGDKAYYGRNSLISAARDAVRDESINWQHIFNDVEYRLYEEYDSFDEFRNEIMRGSSRAAKAITKIFRSKGWGLFDSLTKFKEWIADIIEGNHLKKTGIVFIWDEFTTYVRNNPNDDVLQPLSEFCKEQPFFMFLVVHKAESWVKQMGEDVYERITHRFHSLNFHVSENSAYDLICGSIEIRAGMTEQWNEQKDTLMKTIAKYIPEFDGLNTRDKIDKLRKLFPLHPMTLSMLAIVAQNFGAAQRTIFRFMKDADNSQSDSGFVYFINKFGPDGWRWLTPDFLWDYFFTRESDIHTFSQEAQKAYQHFTEKYEHISGEIHMHVFKAAMLLIAVMSTGSVSNLYSRAVERRIAATRNTLYKCFAGQMTHEDVDTHLAALVDIGVLSVDSTPDGRDVRLQIPYSSIGDVFSTRKKEITKKYSRYEIFKKNGDFSRSIEAKLWKNRASINRMIIAACDSGTTSINARFGEIQTELKRYPYKFGILAIAISEPSQFVAMHDKVKALAQTDTTRRCAVYLLKNALTEGDLDRWYNAMTHASLAGDEGKSGDKSRYEQEANTIIDEWSEASAEGQIMAVCGRTFYPAEDGAGALAAKIERGILFGTVFTSAPELLVQTTTAFKRNQNTTVLAGIQKVANTSQVANIAAGLKKAGVWDIDSLEKLAQASGNETASAVGRLAKFILDKFSQGTRIRLDALWWELQEAPYGCYNCMACGYILGFVMRFYVNSQFTWNKGDNNTHFLSEQNLATMIAAMLREETVNNYLSPGSEVWQKFKPYVQKIFRLSDSEAVNEVEAKKYMSKKCTESGLPFWVLKYADADNFGGLAAKSTACEIVDMFCGFMNDSGDSEKLMNDITAKFAGLGSLRSTIGDMYFEHGAAFEAFSLFIAEKCPEIQELREKLGLSGRDLFDGVRQMMQGEISTWTETQVQEKLSELCLEYRAAAILNDALNLQRKSIRLIGEDIANALGSMKIPAAMIAKMGYVWFPALKAMRDIAVTQWNKLELSTRREYVKILAEGAGEAWSCVESSMPILQEYMRVNGHNCTDDELENIYASLRAVGYESPAADFEARINAQLNKIAYTRNSMRLQELWELRSGCKSVSEWCVCFAVPIQWVAGDEALRHIQTLKTIQDGGTADSTALHNAVQYFESHALDSLRDEANIQNCFFTQIGNNYRNTFERYGDVLISRLRTNPRLTADVYTWGNKIPEIRATLDKFLREKDYAEAKKNVQKMPEAELRSRVLQLLDNNPNLYTLFIN